MGPSCRYLFLAETVTPKHFTIFNHKLPVTDLSLWPFSGYFTEMILFTFVLCIINMDKFFTSAIINVHCFDNKPTFTYMHVGQTWSEYFTMY